MAANAKPAKFVGPPKRITLDSLRSDWRTRISLTTYFTVVISLVLLIVASILAFYVFNLLKENKYRDTTAIMFLELEKQTHTVKQRLDLFEKEILTKTNFLQNMNEADVILKDVSGEYFAIEKGLNRKKVTYKELGIDTIEAIKGFFIVQIDGINYLAKRIAGQSNVYLWYIDFHKISDIRSRFTNDSIAYILSHQLKIVAANSLEIATETLRQRGLVQYFIKSPVSKGQIKIDADPTKVFYGFFAEVPASNIAIFSETPQEAVTFLIFRLMKNFTVGAMMIIFCAIILLQLIIPRAIKPIVDLVVLTKRISKGQFDVTVNIKGFGEVSQLLQAFINMGHGLKRRDTQIIELMEDKRERFRLDQELLIAKKIQENFLPAVFHVKEGVELGSFYQPADAVAGDWYNHFLDPTTGEFFVIVADVSGHGAGSSMFTAVIASQFETFKLRRSASYDIYGLINDINLTFRQLGKSKWHATVVIAIVSADLKQVRLINCGHPFPFLIEETPKGPKTKSVLMPSSPIGIVDQVNINEKTIKLKGTSTFVFFTDGIVEACNEAGRQFGRKNISKACELPGDNPNVLVENLVGSWKTHCGKVKPMDDVCVYALKVKA